jgi:hypothetical protein
MMMLVIFEQVCRCENLAWGEVAVESYASFADSRMLKIWIGMG